MSGRLGIRMPDGSLITDPTWVTVSDVMAGAHGQGQTRVVGELVTLPAMAWCLAHGLNPDVMPGTQTIGRDPVDSLVRVDLFVLDEDGARVRIDDVGTYDRRRVTIRLARPPAPWPEALTCTDCEWVEERAVCEPVATLLRVPCEAHRSVTE